MSPRGAAKLERVKTRASRRQRSGPRSLPDLADLPLLLTVERVRDVLAVHDRTVRRLIERGALGHVRVGERRIRVLRAQLAEFLQRGTASAVR